MIKKSLIVVALCSSIVGASDIQKVIDSKATVNNASKLSQKKIDTYVEQSNSLYQKYKRAQKELEEQKKYNEQLALLVDKQKIEIPKIENKLTQIDVTNKKIIPLMFQMVSTYEEFLKRDTKFLEDERSARVEQLKDYLSNPELDTAQRFQAIIESYKVEYNYARTLEAYRSTLKNSDTEQTVDFLRVGRVALYYQTLDGLQSGYFDASNNRWVLLPEEYNDSIKQGIDIARKKASPDFLTLPMIASKDKK